MSEDIGPHISIKAEKIFEIFGFPVTNSLITSIIVTIITIILAVYYKKQTTASKKNGFYYLMKFFVNSIYEMFRSVLGDKIDKFFPILFSFFFYILLQNWFGLLPGIGSILIRITEGHEQILVPLFRGNNADLNTTLGLALISVS